MQLGKGKQRGTFVTRTPAPYMSGQTTYETYTHVQNDGAKNRREEVSPGRHRDESQLGKDVAADHGSEDPDDDVAD